jgi:putative transposase
VAFVERFIQTLQQECLDYFVEFGERHMDHFVAEMLAYYHEERPHQAKGNDPLAPDPNKPKKAKRKKGESPPDVVPISQIACRQRLGGRLKHYHRRAT